MYGAQYACRTTKVRTAYRIWRSMNDVQGVMWLLLETNTNDLTDGWQYAA